MPVDAAAYVVEQVAYTSHDGTRIPMFVVRRRDLERSGAAPTLFTAYGGFGVGITPEFLPPVFAWLDRGGIFAEAAVRGGSEFGEDWHRAGMRTHKQNVIDDYLAGAEALARLGWTRADRIAGFGASNGGLLVSAAITQRPDLFGAAIIRVPLTDMIRFPLFGNGKQWTSEYGSPDEPEDFRALLAYSPYHNVKHGVRYPPILVQATDSDDLVDPMHARKFVAAMQWATTGGPVLLAIQHSAGHMGTGGVEGRIAKNADTYAFALSAMGGGTAVSGATQ
jgi:prolyl oligopeptidase